MRSDFIGDCDQFYGLPEAMNKSQYLVPRLTRVQLKNVIEGPAKLYGGKLNSTLTSRLLNESGKVKDELPLLQHSLMRIWNHEMTVDKNGELDLNDYKNIGGVEKALNDHADEALEGMSDQDLLITEKIFQALTTIDENGRKIRRPVLLSQLIALTGASEEKLMGIMSLFIKDRRSFLIINNDGNTNDKIIDISHESLIRQWDRLSKWVDEEGESASIYTQLAEYATSNKKGKKKFLDESELQIIEAWYNKYKPVAAWANRYQGGFDESMNYLNASKAEQSRMLNIEKVRMRNRRYLVFTTMGLLLTVVIGLIWFNKNARLDKEIAEKAKSEAQVSLKKSYDAEIKRYDIEIGNIRSNINSFREYKALDIVALEESKINNLISHRDSIQILKKKLEQ
jgi:hypothetical protein